MEKLDQTEEQNVEKKSFVPAVADKSDETSHASKRFKPDNNTDNLNVEGTKKPSRVLCQHCDRLTQICICEALPKTRIQLHQSRCFVLQHPQELRHKNRSLPIVELCIDPECIKVHTGKLLPATVDFDGENTSIASQKLHPQQTDDTIVWLVYPSNDSISLTQAIEKHENDSALKDSKVTLIFIDATWRFARDLIRKNENLFPKNMWRVCLGEDDFENLTNQRRFAIRTPPSEQQKSTAECMAWVLSRVEEQPSIYETIMQPLDLMVEKWTSFIPEEKKRKSSKQEPPATNR